MLQENRSRERLAVASKMAKNSSPLQNIFIRKQKIATSMKVGHIITVLHLHQFQLVLLPKLPAEGSSNGV